MKYPAFFDQVEMIQLQDPLSNFLGAFEGGKLEIAYLDCVKLAGHSCPTVAGAYLMALKGLEALYPDTLPQRGEIKVEMRESETEGVTGVVCSMIAFIAGAGGAGGFKGLQGNMSRNSLISYGADIAREVRLTRIDTGVSVELDYDPSGTPPSPQMMPLMKKMMQQTASSEEKRAFGILWQERVEKILLNKENWDQMITVEKGLESNDI
ncbi:MAG: FmdE family protein [Campylobacterota bacterium]|nr:FmdE family protein [Campylobacterota bacterium]